METPPIRCEQLLVVFRKEPPSDRFRDEFLSDDDSGVTFHALERLTAMVLAQDGAQSVVQEEEQSSEYESGITLIGKAWW